MEKNQFTFTGCRWMSPEKIQKIREQLLNLLHYYGIEFEIILQKDTQIVISNYDDILQSPNDDSTITFIKKFKNEYVIKKFKNEYEQSSDGNAYLLDEDCLLIMSMDDDMEISAKLVTFYGNIIEI